MTKIADQKLAQALYQLVDRSDSASLDAVLTDFASYLSSTGALAHWPAIAVAYRRYCQAQAGVIEAEVVSARQLSAQQLKSLSVELTKLMAAKNVVIIEKLNPDILGGVIVRLPDRLLDASYRRQLRNLQANLLY